MYRDLPFTHEPLRWMSITWGKLIDGHILAKNSVMKSRSTTFDESFRLRLPTELVGTITQSNEYYCDHVNFTALTLKLVSDCRR